MIANRVLPKVAPYLIAATMAVGAGTAKLNAANDTFQKEEPVTEVQQTDDKAEKKENSIPWLDIMTVGCLLSFLGIVELAKHLEKKEKEAEAQNNGNAPKN